jgi:hypothetical protein
MTKEVVLFIHVLAYLVLALGACYINGWSMFAHPLQGISGAGTGHAGFGVTWFDGC